MSIGGVILAGGRSSRMGSPKPALEFGGETLLDRTVRVVTGVVQPVVVVLAAGQRDPQVPGVAVVRDEELDGGPLVGLLAGLEWLSRRGLSAGFVTACDMPFLTGEVVQAITREWRAEEVAVPRIDGRWHPLAAVYSTALIPRIRERLAADRRSLTALIEDSRHRVIEPGVLARVDPDGLAFVNVNTPGEYEAARARLRSRGSRGEGPQSDPPPAPSMVTIRPASPDDSDAISELIVGLSKKFITPHYSATGAAVLLEAMSPAETRARIENGFRYIVAVDDGRIVGIGAMKDRSHLFHLFVAESHHGRGLARRLWDDLRNDALASGNPGRITVNSSRYAVPVYLRFGFVKDGGITEKNEVTCQPMIWQSVPTMIDEEDRQI